MYKVKILDHTPFNKEGDVLTIDEFRKIYGHICSSSTSNMEVIEYLKNERSCYLNDIIGLANRNEKPLRSYTGYWFEVIEEIVPIFKVSGYSIKPVLSKEVNDSYFKNDGNAHDLIYLYVIGHGQYLSLKEAIDWFMYGKRFFTGLKMAVNHASPCKPAEMHFIEFSTLGILQAFVMDFNQDLNKMESVITLLEDHFYNAPKDSSVKIKIGPAIIEFKEFCEIIRESFNLSYKKDVVYALDIHNIK